MIDQDWNVETTILHPHAQMQTTQRYRVKGRNSVELLLCWFASLALGRRGIVSPTEPELGATQ
jgi:hypothetical protein